MSAAKVALIALVLCLAAAVAGFFYGRHQGVLAESAKRDATAVQGLLLPMHGADQGGCRFRH